MEVRLTRKAVVIISLVVLLIVSVVTGFIVWRLNDGDTIGNDKADAGTAAPDCPAPYVQDGDTYGEDCPNGCDKEVRRCKHPQTGELLYMESDCDHNCSAPPTTDGGGTGTQGPGQSCTEDSDCAGGYVCSPNSEGQQVCNDPSQNPGGGQCPADQSCGRLLAFHCSGPFGSDCYENGTTVPNRAAALAHINGCGQLDVVCSGQPDQLCGGHEIFRSNCGGGDDGGDVGGTPATKTITGQVRCVNSNGTEQAVPNVKISVTGADGSSPEKRTGTDGRFSINITEDAFKFDVNILPVDYPYGQAYTGIRTDLKPSVCDNVAPGGVGFVDCQFAASTRDGFEFVFPSCGEVPPQTANPPVCTGMNIYVNGVMKGKNTVINENQKASSIIQVKVAGKDLDGMPAGLRICYARGNQGNTYYAGNVYTCKTAAIENVSSNEGKITIGSFSYNQIAQEIVNKEVAAGINLGAITNQQGIKFISGIANNDATNFCSTNPSQNNGTGTIYNNTNAGTDPFRGGSGPQPGNNCGVSSYDGLPCIANLTVPNEPPPPYCGDGTVQPQEPYNETCEPESDPTCRASCTKCGDGVLQQEEGELCEPALNPLCTAQCTLPTCPNGTVDPGEQCDPQDPVTGPNCTNTCTLKQPKWKVEKGGGYQCIEVGQTADVTYTVTVTNTGQGSGAPSKIEDTLPTNVQAAWVQTDSISDGGVFADGKITWSNPATLAVNASKQYTYKLKIPYGNSGTYQNLVRVFYSGEISFKSSVASDVLDVNCAITPGGSIPNTGIFDSAAGKIVGGLVIVGVAMTYMYFDKLDKVVLNKISPYEKLKRSRREFEEKVTDKE